MQIAKQQPLKSRITPILWSLSQQALRRQATLVDFTLKNLTSSIECFNPSVLPVVAS